MSTEEKTEIANLRLRVMQLERKQMQHLLELRPCDFAVITALCGADRRRVGATLNKEDKQ